MKEIKESDINQYGRFAVILKCLLVKRHVTQGELADAIGISRATITNYIKGKYTPTQQSLEKIANYLNVSPQEFYSSAVDYIPYQKSVSECFAENLSELMKKKGITQTKLAEIIKVSRQSINYYANGSMMPTKEVMERICEFFGVSEEELLNRKAENKSEIRIIVNRMPKEKSECLFIKHSEIQDCTECKFGGLCDINNCQFLIPFEKLKKDEPLTDEIKQDTFPF